MTRRGGLLAVGAGLALLLGCSAPSVVQIHSFSVHTEEMAAAFEATYREALALLDEAPHTPDLAEVHERLLEEEEALDHSFGPIRESLEAANAYAASVQTLVHDSRMPAADAVSSLQDSIRGMLGPVGALAPPLPGTQMVSEIGKAVAEIQDLRRARNANRTLTRALGKLRPAIRLYVAEVRADLKDLHAWTKRVIDLLQEQNRRIHADSLTIQATYAARLKQARHALALLASLDLTEVGTFEPGPLLLPYPTGKARQKALTDPMSPLRVDSLRRDLEHLHSTPAQAAGVARLDAALRRVAGALRARKALTNTLERKGVAVPVEATHAGTVGHRLNVLLHRLEEQIPPPGSLGTPQDATGARLTLDLDTAGTAALHLVQKLAVRVREALDAARPRGACGDPSLLTELALAQRGLKQALLGATGAEQLAGDQVSESIDHLYDGEADRVVTDLRGDLAWIGLLAQVRPGSVPKGPLPAGLTPACRQGLEADLPKPHLVAHLRSLWRRSQGTVALRARVVEFVDILDSLVGDGAGGGHLDPTATAPTFVALDAAVGRLWKAAESAHELAGIDEVIAQAGLPNAAVIEARETHWRQQIAQLAAEAEIVASDIEAFRDRRAALEGSRVRLTKLLEKGEGAIHAWETVHLGLDSLLRSGAGDSPLSILKNAIQDHHDTLGAK